MNDMLKHTMAKAEHTALRNELIEVIRRHQSKLSAVDILAVTAHMVGQVIAFQDQRKFSPDTIMAGVLKNIEAGNMEAIQATFAETEGNA